jgi:hypothetical protein
VVLHPAASQDRCQAGMQCLEELRSLTEVGNETQIGTLLLLDGDTPSPPAPWSPSEAPRSNARSFSYLGSHDSGTRLPCRRPRGCISLQPLSVRRPNVSGGTYGGTKAKPSGVGRADGFAV